MRETRAVHRVATAKRWTLEEIHSLPDDGNKYELVDGQLFVTPPPPEEHENILARLSAILQPFVAAQGLGAIYHPRAVLRFAGSETEPDLMVRQARSRPAADWEHAPTPILVVEVLSEATRQRDLGYKREFYTTARVGEYWIVDPNGRTIRVVKADQPDVVVADELRWSPQGATRPLTIPIGSLFG